MNLGEPSLKKNGKISKGGGFEKNRGKFPISICEFEKPRGLGVSSFQKCLTFNYFAILPL